MDFLKTLLLYMTLTVASSIQAAPTPEVTVPPTLSPVATVSVVTPAPTATPLPEPTITPNYRYKTLSVGSRGNDVRKMQQRLIELGYLTGAADGAYGYQTANAVRTFQRANGLSVDGAAGPATLTALLENPKVKPNPATITPSPEPTATPDINGMIPVPDEPLSLWKNYTGAAVLVNGQALQRRDGSRPGMWMRGTMLILSVNDMAEMAEDWSFSSDNSVMATLQVAQRQMVIQMKDALADSRAATDESYCDMYNLWVDSRSVTTAQGDIVYNEGKWYITDELLKKAVGADVIFDAEENTLLIRYADSNSIGNND